VNKLLGVILVLISILFLFGCTQPSYCGDGFCTGMETPYTCSMDCGSPTYKLGDYTFLYSNAYMEDSSFFEQIITYNTEFNRMGTGVGFSTNNTMGDSFSVPIAEGEIIIRSVSADCDTSELYAVIMNTNNVSNNYKIGDQIKISDRVVQIEDIYYNFTKNAGCINYNYLDVNTSPITLCVGEISSNFILTDVRVPQKNCSNIKTLFRVIGSANTVDFVLTEKTNMYTASMFNDKQTFLQVGDTYSLSTVYFEVSDIVSLGTTNELRANLHIYSPDGNLITIKQVREGEEIEPKLLVKNIFVGINNVNGIIVKRLD